MKSLIKRVFVLSLILTLIPVFSYAWEPGGCVKSGKVCYGPVIAVATLIDNDGNFETGVGLGPGYGVRFLADRFYSAGIDLFLFSHTGGDNPNKLRLALTGSFLRSLRFGYSLELTEGKKARGLWVAGIGLDFKSP